MIIFFDRLNYNNKKNFISTLYISILKRYRVTLVIGILLLSVLIIGILTYFLVFKKKSKLWIMKI